ncbi:MAG: hypothetical protein RBT75_06250 [Anaerolineae bacterium]|jgi:hypothetical protein|nr:hypothetical protein [Anaerolineae bacterium]
MKRGWLLLIGILLGLGLGFLFGWGLWPVQYYDTSPAQLRTDYRDEYLRLVALSYQVEQDLSQARTRLTVMGDSAPFPQLVAQIEAWMTEGASRAFLEPLVELAHDLGVDSPAMHTYLEGATP